MMMEGGVYLFHIMAVAPLLLYIGLKKPEWSESALVVMAVTALAVHLRLLLRVRTRGRRPNSRAERGQADHRRRVAG